MADKEITVQRPVAYPDKFLGAPFLPSIMIAMVCGLGMLVLFAFRNYALYGVLMLPLWVVGHGFLVAAGMKEPHLTTIMQTWHLTRVSPRTLGNRGRSVRVFHP